MEERYWVISPYDYTHRETWEKVWQFDLENQIISVGWRELGDISAYDEVQLKEAYIREYGNTLGFNQIKNFYHSIKIGDVIIARRGLKSIAAIGTVTQTAYYERDKNIHILGETNYYPNHIGVSWQESPRDIQFDRIVFGRLTLYEISESTYRELLEGRLDAEDEPEVQSDTEFVLEKYLEDFIVANFDAIFHKKLSLYKDPEADAIAQQYVTEVGKIDILAQEAKTGNFVVIELKKGRESDVVVGQILRYMGWVQENLCKNDQTVSGLIICKDVDPKLEYALKMVKNVDLKLYRVKFELIDKPLS